ncbi:MAG TPA: hypothetical protein VFY26_07130 [Anaerolineales bacterium]|nr:hypothetical protein [Anaerolineales bacterium]
MATTKKKNSGRSWKNERASVDRKNKSRPKSNKYNASDKSSRKDNAEQYWRAGYTRADGTRVKGHYVRKKTSLIEKIVDAVT